MLTTCPLCKGKGELKADDLSFGDRMRASRGAQTQTTAAKKLGVSRTQLTNIESGRSKPSLDVLIAAAKYYKVTTDYLLGQSVR